MNARRKTNKIILFSALAVLAVIAGITLALQSSADDKLIDGLRDIRPALATNEAPKLARSVCTHGVTVENITAVFFVDAGTAARMTAPISTFCQG